MMDSTWWMRRELKELKDGGINYRMEVLRRERGGGGADGCHTILPQLHG